MIKIKGDEMMKIIKLVGRHVDNLKHVNVRLEKIRKTINRSNSVNCVSQHPAIKEFILKNPDTLTEEGQEEFNRIYLKWKNDLRIEYFSNL